MFNLCQSVPRSLARNLVSSSAVRPCPFSSLTNPPCLQRALYILSAQQHPSASCQKWVPQHLARGSVSPSARRWATSTTPHSTASDPAEVEALQCLEQGTQKLEEGDVHEAKKLYMRSVEIKRNASSLFNLGVTHYHLKEFDEAIAAWKESIELQPSSADAHTNLASAYIMSPVARPDLALQHLQIAASLAPEEPEIAFNLAAVLEACGHLEDALHHYKRSQDYGVERAAIHIRNVSAKILGKRMQEQEAANQSNSDSS